MRRVWYHGNCYDGFGSAYVAWTKFGDHAVYEACKYGQELPFYEPEDEIYIVDFSFPREVMEQLREEVNFLIVLDHHKTAQADCEGLDFCVFDMERSGVGLTWDYFYNDLENGKGKRPYMIDLIEDRDLWKFEYEENTKQLHAYLCSQPFDFDVWAQIETKVMLAPNQIFEPGQVLLDSKAREVEKICENYWVADLGGATAAIVNTTAHWSEVGHRLLDITDCDFAASFTVFEKEVMFSLRSEGDFDVSEIAKQNGGGGHKNAAGFKMNIKDFGKLLSKFNV